MIFINVCSTNENTCPSKLEHAAFCFVPKLPLALSIGVVHFARKSIGVPEFSALSRLVVKAFRLSGPAQKQWTIRTSDQNSFT